MSKEEAEGCLEVISFAKVLIPKSECRVGGLRAPAPGKRDWRVAWGPLSMSRELSRWRDMEGVTVEREEGAVDGNSSWGRREVVVKVRAERRGRDREVLLVARRPVASSRTEASMMCGDGVVG